MVVVGAGTAGLEAACTAAEVGCHVTLLEKTDKIGGLSVEISKIPAKKRLADFPTYLKARAGQLENLTILTNTEGTLERVRQYHPHLVVNATGSVPILPPIDGLAQQLQSSAPVFSILDFIAEVERYPEDLSGKRVVVVGGGAVGLDVVEFFVSRNAQITLVEMLPTIGNGLDASSIASVQRIPAKGTSTTTDRHCFDQSTPGRLFGQPKWHGRNATLRLWICMSWHEGICSRFGRAF
ncbi:FAD/NAD(P)-binding oxidoreductase [Suipraeoptans intestinalis]|uniref:FAD/NAD(P)-binding oxidoreductase n=1 Tax=Suipraeoptans intestinalis TaxID=2606628 RepID=UPI002ED64AB9